MSPTNSLEPVKYTTRWPSFGDTAEIQAGAVTFSAEAEITSELWVDDELAWHMSRGSFWELCNPEFGKKVGRDEAFTFEICLCSDVVEPGDDLAGLRCPGVDNGELAETFVRAHGKGV